MQIKPSSTEGKLVVFSTAIVALDAFLTENRRHISQRLLCLAQAPITTVNTDLEFKRDIKEKKLISMERQVLTYWLIID